MQNYFLQFLFTLSPQHSYKYNILIWIFNWLLRYQAFSSKLVLPEYLDNFFFEKEKLWFFYNFRKYGNQSRNKCRSIETIWLFFIVSPSSLPKLSQLIYTITYKKNPNRTQYDIVVDYRWYFINVIVTDTANCNHPMERMICPIILYYLDYATYQHQISFRYYVNTS